MSNYLVDGADLTSIANAIRTKGGTSAQLAFPQGFADAIAAIPTGGTPTGTKQISITANGTTTEDVAAYANAEITVNVQGGGGWTIDEITRYAGITGNIEITNSSIGEYCLYKRTGITGVSLPNVVTGAQRAFLGCTNIANISAPNLATGNAAMFNGAFTVGISVHFPKLSNFGGAGMFEGARFAIGVFPAVTSLYGSAFANSTYIHVIDLGPNLTTIGSQNNNFKGQSWGNQHGLETLILRRSASVVSLGNISNFTNSRFASGGAGGTIYIPKALYDHLGDGSSLDYKAATNWSTINGYGTIAWAQIEGSIYETQYADGTPIPAA